MWKIYDKTGTIEKVDLSQLTYTGNFMEENFITMTIYSPCPINLEIGDYIEYRGEKFELNYFPTAQKNSSTWSSGDAYVYDSVKFNSFSHELKTCDFIDVVLSDNNIHFTLLPVFQFFASTVKDLADRIQANLDRIYTGDRKWTITVDDNAAGLTDINVSVNKVKCWDALLLSKSLFGVNFIIRGRTVTIGKTGLSVGKVFGYGKNNGFISIKQNTNSDALFITRLRAYGSTRNLPDNYYNRLKKPDGTALIPESMYVKNLMLPSFRKDGITAYIDSPNIDEYGIREDSVYFDGSDQSLPNVFPSMEGMTAEDLASAGIIVNATGRLDEIVSAEQITDSGVPPEGEELSKITFTVTLKDLGFDPKEHKTTETPLLAMKSGTCNSREFEILDCVKQGNNYVLTCERSYDKSINVYFPNKYYNLEADDRFVFLNIEMDELYILAAEQRLLTAAQDYLSKHDKTKFIYEPKIDNVFMARNPIFHDTIKEGDVLDFSDTDFDINDSVIIQTLTIKEGGEVPEYEITLYNDTGDTKTQNVQGSIKSLEDQVNITSEELNDARNLISLFGIDSNGNVYLKRGRDFYTYGGISALGSGIPGTGGSGASSMGELINVGSWADQVQPEDIVMVKLADATHWSYKPLSDLFDTDKLAEYLSTNKYATQDWVEDKNYLTDSSISSLKTDVDELKNLLDWFGVDDNGNVFVKENRSFYTLSGGISANGAGVSGGSGGSYSLSELIDVELSNLAAGQLLKYDGTHWINFDQSEITPDLTGYATESWVQSQGYLTEHQDLSGYLPSSGGTMTGDIIFNNNVNIRWKNITGDTLGQLYFNNNNILVVGNRSNAGLVLRTGSTDILHDRNGDSYKVWDSYNLPNPAKISDLDGYLPLTAGATKPLTGQLFANQGVNLPFNVALRATNEDGDIKAVVYSMPNNRLVLSDASYDTVISSRQSDLIHRRTGTAYKIWDAYNLSSPAKTSDLANYIPRAAENNAASLLTKPGGIYRQGASVDGEFGYSCNMLLRFDSGGTNWYTGGILSISTGGELRVAGVSNGTLSVWRNMAVQGMVNNFVHTDNEVTFVSQSAALPHLWLNFRGCSEGIEEYWLGSGKADNSFGGLVAARIKAMSGFYLPNATVIKTASSTGGDRNLAYMTASNIIIFGDNSNMMRLCSEDSAIQHSRWRNGKEYLCTIWDSDLLPNPARQETINNFLYNGNEVNFINKDEALSGVWLNYRGCTGGITNYHLGSGKGDGTYGNLVVNNIVANGGVSAAGVSDARLKHDINPLDDALSLINMLKVKTFRYNSIARELDNNLPVRDAGFIAQEFVKVFPEHVKEMYDGKYLGIRYDKMIPYLTRGIQEVDNNTRKIKQVTVEILDIIGSTGIGEPVKMKIHELLNTLNTIR